MRIHTLYLDGSVCGCVHVNVYVEHMSTHMKIVHNECKQFVFTNVTNNVAVEARWKHLHIVYAVRSPYMPLFPFICNHIMNTQETFSAEPNVLSCGSTPKKKKHIFTEEKKLIRTLETAITVQVPLLMRYLTPRNFYKITLSVC